MSSKKKKKALLTWVQEQWNQLNSSPTSDGSMDDKSHLNCGADISRMEHAGWIQAEDEGEYTLTVSGPS